MKAQWHVGPQLALVFLATAAIAGEVDPRAEAIEAAVRAELKGHDFAGLSIAVSHGDFTWTRAFGQRDLARRRPATVETTYRLASITKSFTAVAVMQLVEQGKVKLDQDIRTLVPAYPEKPWPITVRQLLGHLGGVPHYANQQDGKNGKALGTAEALALFADKPLAAEPGTEFVYTTWGYNLLGAAVETASGQDYGSYLREHVFAPSGMKTAALDAQATRTSQHAVGYRRRNGKLVPSEYLDVSSRFAGGGTRGSVLDLVAFGRAVLDHRLVSPESTTLMQTVLRTRDGRLTDYGLGFAVYPQRGRYVVAHAGGQPETTALLVLYPADNLILAFAANLEGEIELFRRLQTRVVELLLEGGTVRREASARDPVARAQYETLYRVFTYGIAYERWRRARGNDAAVVDGDKAAFERVRELLKRESIVADVRAHRKKLRASHEPREQSVVLSVGIRMADTIARWKGAEALAAYPRRGPLEFFSDYALACKALKCPPERTFSAIEEALTQMLAGWRKAELPELVSLRLYDAKAPLTSWKALHARAAGAAFGPDYSEELFRLAERAREEGAYEAERAWLLRAHQLYPAAASPLLELGDAEARAGKSASALRRYQKAFELDPTAEVLEPEALIARAQREPVRRVSKELLAAASVLHPDDPAVWRALARAERALGRTRAAASAQRKADQLETAAGTVRAAD